ncbi:MAG TPA: NeuD/PglB/VioB family sugar acetyltransferase [Bacteroidales bacterium]|nr:NeuD/PglB/VioB family sugar acetyltransferase [Bacteroidales bacterium]HQK67036.1 NeuD/PglB/VioB family sugar acetyltransferase [Bacteroidales bacterium]
MKTKKVLILGGGGNASVIGYALLDAFNKGHRELEFSGYINDRDNVNEIEGYPVLGGLKDIPELLKRDYYFINAIGKIGVQKERITQIESLRIPDNRFVTFIHPSAYVAPNVKLGCGCVIMPNVSISPGTSLGKCCRVMIGAVIGHNNIIGQYCFFAAASCTGAYISIGDGVFISLNATLREFIKIGNYSTVGMGAVLLNSIGENEIWVGNPAKILNK